MLPSAGQTKERSHFITKVVNPGSSEGMLADEHSWGTWEVFVIVLKGLGLAN
jgi:hypothetical protein